MGRLRKLIDFLKAEAARPGGADRLHDSSKKDDGPFRTIFENERYRWFLGLGEENKDEFYIKALKKEGMPLVDRKIAKRWYDSLPQERRDRLDNGVVSAHFEPVKVVVERSILKDNYIPEYRRHCCDSCEGTDSYTWD